MVQDNVWLPPTFVERTIGFYRDHERDVLLSYPERRIYPPMGRLSKELMNNRTVRNTEELMNNCTVRNTEDLMNNCVVSNTVAATPATAQRHHASGRHVT